MTSLHIFEQFPVTAARGWKRGGLDNGGGWKMICAVFLFCAATEVASSAQDQPASLQMTYTSFTTLADVCCAPNASLIQGTDGALYGTTASGGQGQGTVFKITPSGMLTTLHSFAFVDGAHPQAGLVQATNGNFYGTTTDGGAYSYGTVFKMTPQGELTTLYSFCAPTSCADGANPQGALIQATDGNLYGATSGPGYGGGTLFKITPAGTLTTLYSFGNGASCTPVGALVQATDGNFYGTTLNTCGYYGGTVFKITPTGKLTTLHIFDYIHDFPNGAYPLSGLVQGRDGNFYGTTSDGGNGNVEVGGAPGIVFKITASGSFTVLHRFNWTDGSSPRAALIQVTDGNLYGTAIGGGANGYGTAFKITPGGTLTTLYSFGSQSGCTDGYFPVAGLVQDTNADFYGTTAGGTTSGPCQQSNGTVFRLSVGLSPFVSFMRSSGKVGQTVQILGQGLTGATKVSFNGANAAFIVKSGNYLTATIPGGATTGFVTVTTPSGTLASNQKFRVTPQILSFSPTSGPVGTSVVITGKSLAGATNVTLACKWPMSFTVDSNTQITAIVPSTTSSGTSGTIAVRTPGGRVESSTKFTVTP
jgi:uncharacterized repeat protein (TIGR03803 family)